MTYEIKIITLGDTGVGKTSILKRIVDDSFDKNMVSTMGMNPMFLKFEYKLKKIKIQLNFMDTAGQERFKEIPKLYIRNCHIVLLIYKDEESFNELKNRWLKYYKENANIKESKFIIIANKSDLFGENRKEITQLGRDFAEELNNSQFFSCSAKSKDNIENLLDCIKTEAKRIVDKKEEKRIGDEEKADREGKKIQNNSNNINNSDTKNIKINKKVINNNINVQMKAGCC